MFYAPHIDSLELPCDRLPRAFDRLTVLHLSDLHITRWTRRLDRWRDALAGYAPDVLAITGDLGHRSWHWKTTLASLEKLLEPLSPRLGTYFILGNHDSLKLGPALAATRDATGKPRIMLQNQTVFITRSGKGFAAHLAEPPAKLPAAAPPAGEAAPRLALVGVHQHRRIDTDIPLAMRFVAPEDFKLLLMHYPDLVYPAAAAGADICLAGHTHGGQICWPDGSPIFRHDTLSAPMCTGVHRVNGAWMVVNRGIGSAGIKMRMFCPPQAMMITLRNVEGEGIAHTRTN